MSNPPLGPYLIAERVGTSVWLAEDTRSGKKVAVKLLNKSLPKDPAKREGLIREVRVAAAMVHASLVPILEIAAEGDNLLMVMEVVEGKSLTRRLRGEGLAKPEFFRLAYQLASALKFLHTKGLLHGNITGDSVMVSPEGHLRLGGLNLNNLLRRDRSSKEYAQKSTDVRTVSYLAPETISAQAIDERSDVFSYGVVLYEMATGRLPFPGTDAAEAARAIVEKQPVSPRSVNAQIEPAVMSILGACLFKDPGKRHKDMKPVLEFIESADAEASAFAAQLEKKLVVPIAGQPAPVQRETILLVADVADHEALAAEDPERAARVAARLQQVLGEAVYLFDGQVLDPFGTRVIAEMPSVDRALEAGRKGEFDFSPGQQDSPMAVRMLLHAGALEIRDGVPTGPAVEKALETLQHLPPNQLFISEAFAKGGRGNVRLRDFGARAGVKLFTIVPAEPVPDPATEVEPSTAEIEAELVAEMEAEAALRRAMTKKRRNRLALVAAALVVLLLVGGATVMFLRRNVGGAETAAPATAAAPSRPTAANPATIHLAAFTIEGADPALAPRAQAVLLASSEILKTFPELRLAETTPANGTPFSANVRNGAAGAEILPTFGVKAAPAVPLPDDASGIRALVTFVATEAEVTLRPIGTPEALNAFAAALVAGASGDDAGAETSIRAALTADPTFLPGQLLAMRFFSRTGKTADAVLAAKQVATLDPANVEALRTVARASLSAGNLQEAFAYYDLVLKRERDDAEALNHVARYSASIADSARFAAALERLKRVQPVRVAAHEPDLLTAGGRIDAAIQRYYTIEEAVPNSPALALKIGRLAVLRRSLPIAEIELKKLQQMDPLYGRPMLAAYIAAEQQDGATALAELNVALAAAVPGDDAWTSAAEVHAILADTPGVIASLEKAAERKEPTAAYILSNPLFRYLDNDPRFQKIRGTLAQQQDETRAALAQVK